MIEAPPNTRITASPHEDHSDAVSLAESPHLTGDYYVRLVSCDPKNPDYPWEVPSVTTVDWRFDGSEQAVTPTVVEPFGAIVGRPDHFDGWELRCPARFTFDGHAHVVAATVSTPNGDFVVTGTTNEPPPPPEPDPPHEDVQLAVMLGLDPAQVSLVDDFVHDRLVNVDELNGALQALGFAIAGKDMNHDALRRIADLAERMRASIDVPKAMRERIGKAVTGG